MPDTVVLCGTATANPRPRDALRLNLSQDADPRQQIHLDLAPLKGWLVDDLPPIVADLVEIAAYIFSADRMVRRGNVRMSRMGADWRRAFRFTIPVRAPDVWRSKSVKDQLTSALAFLSEDSFDFNFVPAPDPHERAPHFAFGRESSRSIDPEEVMLFSGGLDSLAGAAETLLGSSRRALLVTHQSSTFVAARQNQLADSLLSRLPQGQAFYAPIWVRKGGQEPVEHTQRLRSFLFVALGALVAHMSGLNRLLFFENGVTSFNLPLADHVIGTRASRTTHPRVLRDFGSLLSSLFEVPFSVENPFIWKTKADVVSTIAEHECADLIAETTSCARVRELPMTEKQCGTCSQCIERRFALISAGLGACEPADFYNTELFGGIQTKPIDLAMIEHHVLRAERFASMSEQAFLGAYGEVFRALSCFPMPPDKAARQIYQLHRRYGEALTSVVGREVVRQAAKENEASPPANSLLSVFIPSGARTPVTDPVEVEPAPSRAARQSPLNTSPPRFLIALDEEKKEVLTDDCEPLKGQAFELLRVLIRQTRADREANKPGKESAFVKAEAFEKELGWSDEQLRQIVIRTRRRFERNVEVSTGYTPDREDLIETHKWHGYRLNPHLVEVSPSQILSAVSRSSRPGVTTRASAG